MKIKLLDYIVCSVCREHLRIASYLGNGAEIASGKLVCPHNHEFAITNGIPRLLQKVINPLERQTQVSFSEKWKRIPDYGYEEKTKAFRVEWHLRRYGWNNLEGLSAFLSGRRFVLDVGTGLGGYLEMYAKRGKGEIIGVDISDAIDLAQSHVAHLPNVYLAQADLNHLPFPEKFFDFILADQVLHHTPNTMLSFFNLVNHLTDNGSIALYVYKKKSPIRELADTHLRGHTTKMSADECYEFSKSITQLGRTLSKLKTDVNVPCDIPLLGIKAGKQDIQRFFYWNFLKCFWNKDMDFETNVMTNFDWYHPRFAWRHTPEEVKRWFKVAGLVIEHEEISESGISIRGSKK